LNTEPSKIPRVAIVTEQDLFYRKYKNLLASHPYETRKLSWDQFFQSYSDLNFELYLLDNEQESVTDNIFNESFNLQSLPSHIISIGRKISTKINPGALCISLPSDSDQSTFSQILSVLAKVIQRETNQLELASMLLHDIRSPLNSLVGYLELLINGTFGKLPNGHANIVEKAIDMSDYTLDLVEELADIYKYEQKFLSIQRESISFSEMLDSLLAIIWVKADQKNLKMKRSIPENLPPIIGDEFQIQRLTSNIITNAIKHTPKNSTISIELKSLRNQFAQISVHDQGEGVPDDEIPLLFDKYFRLHQRSLSDGGQGLGLYICRIITEAHHGKIWAENKKTGGLTIHFTLPFQQAS
jgi:signal transduction histidine kinase